MRQKTQEIYHRLKQVIPGGVNSPVRACLAVKQLPLIIDRAEADLIFDVDGKSYIDFCGSWGALIHGHAHPAILDAAEKRMRKGTSFGISTAIEEQLARKVTEIVPSIEKIRFVSSGTEATMSAVRLARGYTSRSVIVKFSGNYHGHADQFLVQAGSGVLDLSPTSSSKGIPDEMVKHTLSLPFNDQEAIQKLFDSQGDQIACVILEPVAGNMGVIPATAEFIECLRSLTSRHGALLIFDEVMTGFRVALKGAQDLYDIQPDLTCLGKIVGGGFPAAAFGGKAEIMNMLAPLGPVYQAGTLSGNPVAMEAGLQALLLVEAPSFYKDLQAKTDFLLKPIQEKMATLTTPACIQSVGSMFTLFFGLRKVNHLEDTKKLNKELFAQFFKFLLEKGVYIPPLQCEAWFISMAHSDENLLKTRNYILQFLDDLE
ncbi:Glutamate-1-semialdehyde 2,1-aminomutase [Chlamydiales bacterium STE3]|nr:Glutamate-1-semialdehyde 2,1-aminomutase [Chlamydiales bacterium STE3]